MISYCREAHRWASQLSDSEKLSLKAIPWRVLGSPTGCTPWDVSHVGWWRSNTTPCFCGDLSDKAFPVGHWKRTPALQLSCSGGRAAEDTTGDAAGGVCQSVLEQSPRSLVPGLPIQRLEAPHTCLFCQGWHHAGVDTAQLPHPPERKGSAPPLLFQKRAGRNEVC